ncbi:hypothetical protein RFK16_10775, partial [Streptococcus suis]|uniref:hypothetical protein n=1 Tax=Streptococcus suis TaxID=1307 RepID=UPI002FC7C355
PICHGIKILREHVNRKRFQSQQDFGAFFNIPCYLAVTNIHLFTLQRFKNRNNGLAPLEMRNKAVA